MRSHHSSGGGDEGKCLCAHGSRENSRDLQRRWYDVFWRRLCLGAGKSGPCPPGQASDDSRERTVHDHNIDTGLGSFVQKVLFEAGVQVLVKRMGVSAYQLSGTADALYEKAGLSVQAIE